MNKKNLVYLTLLTFFLFPAVTSHAQSDFEDPGGNEIKEVKQESIKLVNPLGGNKDIKSLPDLVEGLLRIVITVGTPIVALAIIYSGFLFITAQGDPTALQKARQTLLYVVIGSAILLGAYLIAEVIVGTVNAIRGQ